MDIPKYPFLDFWNLPHTHPYEPVLYLESADGVDFLVTRRAALLSPHLVQVLLQSTTSTTPIIQPTPSTQSVESNPVTSMRGPRKRTKITTAQAQAQAQSHAHAHYGNGDNNHYVKFFEAKQVSASRIKFTHLRSALLYSIIKCMYHILLHVPDSYLGVTKETKVAKVAEDFNTEASRGFLLALPEIISTFQDTETYNLPWIKKFF
jgi:hypothetical protein